ncbi:PepSY domain-containing protein [Nonomuraea sp. LPB2021202275-12-8]|uniref:PepSY domain-containing protein n=1 Tax=Nonomuraea sp. LPB2021202275-12-8 TaxID=3120159 RepID=UPI00300D19EF
MNGGKRAKVIIGTVFAGSALLTGCGSVDTQSSAVKAVPAVGAIPGLMSPSGPPGGMASIEKAGTAALNSVEGSTLLSLQSENDGKLWGVQLAGPDGTERLLEVDASGKVVSDPRVKDTGTDEKSRVMGIIKDSKLTYKDAAQKVQSSVPEGKITHLSQDRYGNDLLVWDADVVTPDGTWHGVKVDAKDGTVTKNG